MRHRDEIRFFTVEEANRALPLVRRIMADIIDENGRLQELLPRLKEARLRSRRRAGDSTLERLREDVAQISARLERYLGELHQIGCLFKGPQGLVDFYAVLDGRPVLLCWQFDEEEIAYWHELEAGFAGRQPLEAGFLTTSSTG